METPQTKGEKILEITGAGGRFEPLSKAIRKGGTVKIEGASGSFTAVAAASAARLAGGVHIFIAEDRDAASYLCNDLYNFLDNERILLFPTAYKRSIQFHKEDPSGIVQRTAVLNAIRNHSDGHLFVCTYPEAVAEKVVDRQKLSGSAMKVIVGEKVAIETLAGLLAEYKFEKVDFVYEPGQYSVRGGIVDVFSFSDNVPYRIDFFGDEVESIRHFEIGTQLSVDRLQEVEIIPNLKDLELASKRVPFAQFAGNVIYWFSDPEYTLKKFDSIRVKMLSELDEPSSIDTFVTSRRAFVEDTAERTFVVLSDNAKERAADLSFAMSTAPQPHFNKKFEMLAADIQSNTAKGYKTYILSDNKAQIERLDNIFHSIGERNVSFDSVGINLRAGFIDHASKSCFYTDHQIFDRFFRYKVRGEVEKSERLTIAELNSLNIGDYVVHIDHGVGRFGGLTRTMENGKAQEAVKIVYRDNDVLLVSVHSLHRISRYKDKDAEPPRIYKLGSGAWQKMKQAAKKSVKDIARELIKLYARRRASKGFAFSHDSYLQNELEASFIYEDTPDQQKATKAVKKDMESLSPMDRLVCGDVGFGKTEVAIRAAFKAAGDSKQVAVLVPTTILALQHYRTFSDRLRDLPVRVEQLSRAKSAKETKQILEDLKAGKIDILIGTHKILGKDVVYKDLGLLIIDEEQKFGVAAKEKLRQSRENIDTLTLTATPIPRTLQFSLMGSRDLSVITTPPPNRQPIATEGHLFDEEIIREAIEFELSRGGQVYFIHNRVDNIKNIENAVRKVCPAARTVVGHGQMPPQQMEKVMMDFIYGEYDVLISTTIIESGVDVPNANTIIINDAQNFGLSDLHQLRGRVGRSNRKAFCYLLTPPEEMLSSEARRRLRAIEEFSELGAGFNIAMQDLDIRGAGNLLGGEQSGFIADIGFETYQKILNEAMAELREEEAAPVDGALPAEEGAAHVPVEETYVQDCLVETDTEAFIPDTYVSNTAEKIRLYREIDSTTDEETIRRIEGELTDRFGELPAPACELFDIVRLRRECMALGFEKAIVRNGIMILHFVYNQKSSYYRSDRFAQILRYVTSQGAKFNLRQGAGGKLSLTVREIKGVGQGVAALQKMAEETVGKGE